MRGLRDRWLGFGLGEEEINRKVEENDLPNGRFITSASAGAGYFASEIRGKVRRPEPA